MGCSRNKSSDEKPVLQQLDSAQTGVGFGNQVHNTDSLPILKYLYFYNGSP